MRGLLPAFVILILISLGTSWLLLPLTRELALIQLRDNDYVAARENYEQLLRHGYAPVDVYVGLIDLYFETGEIEQAIDILERYVAAHPGNISAHERLGLFYDYDQRPLDKLRNLRELVKLDPSERRMRELVDMVGIYEGVQEQTDAIADLVRLHGGKPQDWELLAELQSSLGHLKEAAQSIEHLWRIDPKAIPPAMAELWLAILVDIGDEDFAVASAKRLLSLQPDTQLAERIAATLTNNGKPRLVLRMLEDYMPGVERSPLAATIVNVLIETDQYDEASGILERAKANGTLTPPLQIAYLETSLAQKRLELALQLSKNVRPENMSDAVLTGLIAAALEVGDIEAIAGLKDRIGPDGLSRHPLLAAQLALALNAPVEADKWVKLAERDLAVLDLEDRITLATINMRVGRTSRATSMFLSLLENPDLPEFDFGDVVSLFLTTGRVREGVQLFDRMRKQRRDPRLEESWVRLASAAGQSSAVLAWLKGRSNEQLDADLLDDVYDLAVEAAKTDLAVAAAERLYDIRHSEEDRRNFAYALIAAKQPAKAVPLLQADLTADGPARQDAVYALIDAEAWREVIPIVATLAKAQPAEWLWTYVEVAQKAKRIGDVLPLLRERAMASRLDRAAREEALYALVEIAPQNVVLPPLRVAVNDLGEPWRSIYEEVLQRFGRTSELAAFWRDESMRPTLDLEKRREYAFNLLSLTGDKTAATSAFQSLAEADGPNGEDTAQLLYLWGPRPNTASLGWLEKRARSAPDQPARMAWLNHLVELGGADRALRLAREEKARSGSDPVIIDIELAALSSLQRSDEVANLIQAIAPTVRETARLERYADLAWSVQRPQAARVAYKQILALKPSDTKALRETGMLEYSASNYGRAAELLGRYVAMEPDSQSDWEAQYYLGECLIRLTQREKSRQHFELALKAIGISPTKSIVMQKVQASSLYRLGRVKEAAAIFEQLVRESRQDKETLVEYVEFLVAIGEKGHAAAVLSGQSSR